MKLASPRFPLLPLSCEIWRNMEISVYQNNNLEESCVHFLRQYNYGIKLVYNILITILLLLFFFAEFK